MTPVVLIDVMNAVFRGHYAFRGLEYEGRPSGLLYGFLKAVRGLQQNVTRSLVFCWDHGVPVPGAERPRNWRDAFMPEYKAHRQHDPAEWNRIVNQLSVLYQALNWLGYSSVAVEGLEADDVMGVLTTELLGLMRKRLAVSPLLIYSTDRDLYQLLGPSVQVLIPHKSNGKFQYVTAAVVERQYGFPVAKWANYLALGGDSSDNIRPIRGVGSKTAERLTREGANPAEPFSLQPWSFRQGHASLEASWSRVRRAYEVVQIPRSWTDPRITACVKGNPPSYCTEQIWENELQRQLNMEQFTRLCADYGLVTLLAQRRQFFGYGETSCPENRTQKSKPRPTLLAEA